MAVVTVTYLKLLAEGVGAVQLHHVLHKLLDRQRLVAVWNTQDRLLSFIHSLLKKSNDVMMMTSSGDVQN